MVTPIWLNGAGCAAAAPAVSVEANNKATNTFVFTDASFLSWISYPGFAITRSVDYIGGKAAGTRLVLTDAAGSGTELPLSWHFCGALGDTLVLGLSQGCVRGITLL